MNTTYQATMPMVSFEPRRNDELVALLEALRRQPKRKRVRFSSELSSSTSAPINNLTREEFKSLWYDRGTIFKFRSQARECAFSIERRASTYQCNNTPDNNKDDASTPRGLETCSYERQLQRHRTIQCVLSCCSKGYTPEQTAAMSKRCSAWNTDVAMLQACHDFFAAYQPNLRLPKICNIPPAFPFQLKRKSNDSRCSQTRRRVRRRTTV